jgi:hypothetical protein
MLRGPESAWLVAQKATYRAQKDYWLRLFRRHNVRLFTTWFKYNGDHCLIGEALHELGGALAIYQRSHEDLPMVHTTLLTDVYFGFSGDGARREAQCGSKIDYYVTMGYIGDHRFPLVRTEARSVRERLQKHGARNIVAFFDEGSYPDRRWGPDAERLRREYSFLLERLLAEPALGLVLKPKVPATVRARLGPVVELLERALATGRCYVYGEGLLQASTPPAQAALSADLAIHSSVVAGTAAIESALAGVPTVLLDEDGRRQSPLYRLGEGRVVFNDWNTLWHTWRQYQVAPTSIPGFADWSPVIDEIDPFRDGRAAERMGTFLKWVIEGFSIGLSKDAALSRAADQYCKIWGQDKITSVRPAPDPLPENQR